jgi:hypothetical protein
VAAAAMGQPTAASSCTEPRQLLQAGAATAVAAAGSVGAAAVGAGNGASASARVGCAVASGVTAGLERMLLQLGRSAGMLALHLQVLVAVVGAPAVAVAAAGWGLPAVLGVRLVRL